MAKKRTSPTQVLKVVLEYMRNHGNRLPTVRWVAERLGVSRTTIYRVCKKQVLVKLTPHILTRGTGFSFVTPNFDPESTPVEVSEIGEVKFLKPTKKLSESGRSVRVPISGVTYLIRH